VLGVERDFDVLWSKEPSAPTTNDDQKDSEQ
jgi:hypothetical protein